MATDPTSKILAGAEALSNPDQQPHSNSPSVFPEFGQLGDNIVEEKNVESKTETKKLMTDAHKLPIEDDASKARPDANEQKGSLEMRNEQMTSAVVRQCGMAELHMKVGQMDRNSGHVNDEETEVNDAQDGSEKEQPVASIPSGSSSSATKCETSSKHKDQKKCSEQKETICEPKGRHAHSSEKRISEHSHSNRDKVKADKHSTTSSSSHQSTAKVDTKSENAKHHRPTSHGHSTETRHHHHSDSRKTSKQKVDSPKDKDVEKLKEGCSDRRQSDKAAKPIKDSHAKEKTSSEAIVTCRKRKLDSPSDESSSSDMTKKPTALQEKRAKMLALVDKQKSELASDIPDEESADIPTSSKDGKGLQFPLSAHPDLIASSKLIYEPVGLICTSKFMKEPESSEYAAAMFSLDKRPIRFRVAKTTPTKNGQFVTFWKRIGKGPIMPYDAKDPVDLLVVCVRDGKNFGQFVFPKSTLIAQDVMSRNGKGGKRAIRVYPPWVKAESTQAMNSQCWQAKHFLNMSDTTKVDLHRARRLYSA